MIENNMNRAYERIVSKSGQEPILPGLEFSQRQLIWLSSASIACKVRRPASLRHYVSKSNCHISSRHYIALHYKKKCSFYHNVIMSKSLCVYQCFSFSMSPYWTKGGHPGRFDENNSVLSFSENLCRCLHQWDITSLWVL